MNEDLRLVKRGEIYQIDGLLDGRRIRISTGEKDKERAEAFLFRKKSELKIINIKDVRICFDRISVDIGKIARLLNCTERHVADIKSGSVKATAQERAILKMCAALDHEFLSSTLETLESDNEWKTIPGYSKYEASVDGNVRRAKAGHGSMPGHVLKPKRSKTGHLYVNIAKDGDAVRPVAVHRAVCFAFHGEPPSPFHVVCHRNDKKSDNSPANLYWGTSQENAIDRVRNSGLAFKKLSQRDKWQGPLTLSQFKQYNKNQMLKRIGDVVK